VPVVADIQRFVNASAMKAKVIEIVGNFRRRLPVKT
jgi:hypothetical protein